MKNFVWKVLEIYKPFRRIALVMLLFLTVMQSLSIISPFLLGKIVDSVVSKKPLEFILSLAGISLGIFLLRDVLLNYYKEKFELDWVDYDIPRYVANKTLKKVFSLSIGQHNNQHSGIKQSIINRGEHSLQTLAFMTLYEVMPLILKIGVMGTFILVRNPLIGGVLITAGLIFGGISIYINSLLQDELENHQEIGHRNYKRHSELLRNVELILVSAQEKKGQDEYDQALARYSDAGKHLWKRYIRLTGLRNVAIGVAKFAIVAVGVMQVYQNQYTPGDLVLYLSLSSDLMGNLWSIGPIHRQVLDLYTAVNKYFTLLDIEPEVKTDANPVKPDNLRGRIEFKDVSFTYPVRKYIVSDEEEKSGEDPKPRDKNHGALFNVSFTIEAGQKIALVGHSGAGKSTIAYLILRAHDPDQGQIIVDENDLRQLDLHEYRRRIGVVEQQVGLFDATLRYNILFGLQNGQQVTDEELREIARISCIDRFFYRLEKGFDTFIGERGVRLSGGERQRVGIARALIKKPKMLILDEATSSLDSENESLIREAIGKASQGKTTIIIAHRLSTIRDADKILVLDKGSLVGQGKHQELLESCETYRNLITHQIVKP
ncbi:MAG: ABC transporter ATP-binding protein [Candidatus Harrisonbacteria bacterium]|nr:ABC transporter ATP-binding protein [Candidatus Harrisonbacteria bacterium]